MTHLSEYGIIFLYLIIWYCMAASRMFASAVLVLLKEMLIQLCLFLRLRSAVFTVVEKCTWQFEPEVISLNSSFCPLSSKNISFSTVPLILPWTLDEDVQQDLWCELLTNFCSQTLRFLLHIDFYNVLNFRMLVSQHDRQCEDTFLLTEDTAKGRCCTWTDNERCLKRLFT